MRSVVWARGVGGEGRAARAGARHRHGRVRPRRAAPGEPVHRAEGADDGEDAEGYIQLGKSCRTKSVAQHRPTVAPFMYGRSAMHRIADSGSQIAACSHSEGE